MKTVATVLVTFNRLKLLQEAISHIRNQTRKADKIIVINNGSTDNTLSWLESQNDLHVITQENVGGAGGFHRGMQEAYNLGYDYIWIMDDDVFADKDCLFHMLNANKPITVPVRIANTKIKSFKDLPPIKYDLKNPFRVETRIEINEYLKIKSFDELPQELPVEVLYFEGPLISREVIEMVGLPEKKLFIYHDDTEFALRCNRKFKIPIVLIRDAVLYRQIEEKDEINWKVYYKFRNKSYIHIKYCDNILVKLKPLALFLSSVVKDLLKFKHDSEKQKYRFWAVVDAYNSNYFKRF